VVAAAPDVLTSGALTWHLIERSSTQRASHPEHDALRSWPTIEASGVRSVTGVVLANELLDNLPFEVLEHHDGAWTAARVGRRDAEGRFALRPGDTRDVIDVPTALDGVGSLPDGATLPWQPRAREWLAKALAVIERGRVVVFDYGATSAQLGHRDGGWLRTHRGHEAGADWRVAPGTCDITSDVAFDQLQLVHRADNDRSQAEWLGAHGIEALVAEGRRLWAASAGVGDLAALRARSRVRESEALLDPDGMGGFRVLEWCR
jgi:SAM-dependent MidA family methyltransferase